MHTSIQNLALHGEHEWAAVVHLSLPDGGCYLGCSWWERALLAWVDCLCLERKD